MVSIDFFFNVLNVHGPPSPPFRTLTSDKVALVDKHLDGVVQRWRHQWDDLARCQDATGSCWCQGVCRAVPDVTRHGTGRFCHTVQGKEGDVLVSYTKVE